MSSRESEGERGSVVPRTKRLEGLRQRSCTARRRIVTDRVAWEDVVSDGGEPDASAP